MKKLANIVKYILISCEYDPTLTLSPLRKTIPHKHVFESNKNMATLYKFICKPKEQQLLHLIKNKTIFVVRFKNLGCKLTVYHFFI